MKYVSIRNCHLLIAALVLTAYFIETGWDNLFAVAFLFLCMMSPIAVNMLAAVFSKTRVSQVILLCATLAYTAWATLLYVDATNSTDGQAGIALLATAIVALPVLVPLWTTCFVIEIRKRLKSRSTPASGLAME